VKDLKLSIGHLRIAMIAVNAGLALGLVGHFVNLLWYQPPSAAAGIKLVPLEVFKEQRKVPTGKNSMTRVTAAGTWLNPIAPVKDPIDVEEEDEEPIKSDDELEAEEQIAKFGPLAENWEYVWCIFVKEDPLKTRVILRKKEAKKKARTPPKRGARAGRASRGRNRSVKKPKRRVTPRAKPGSAISFTIDKRRYEDEEAELDFYMVAADMQKFVYAIQETPGQPLKKYALERVASTQYEEMGKTKDLWVLAPPKEDDGEEGKDKDEEEKPPKNFLIVPDDQEDRREAQFNDILIGKKSSAGDLKGVKSKPIATAGRRTSRKKAPAAKVNKSPAAKPPKKKSSAKTGRITDPEAKKKALNELGEALKDIPDAEKKKIQDALMNPKK